MAQPVGSVALEPDDFRRHAADIRARCGTVRVNRMHIGFDVSQTGAKKAGCGYYADAMARALLRIAPMHRYSLYPSFGDSYFDAMMPLRNPFEGASVQYGPRHLTRDGASRFWNASDLDAALGMPDVVHANNFWTPPRVRHARLVYTLYDLGFVAHPEWTTETNRIHCFNGVFRAAIEADWIVAISESSRRHFLDVFPHFSPERVRVIHPCSRFADTTAEGRRPRSLDGVEAFWLSVGTIEPRKNQRGLAQAYARYLEFGGAPMPLVFAGGDGWLMDDFSSYLEDLGIRDRVILAGYVSDDELVWMYRNCFAHLYPSWFEGFGLPVLEGLQFGAPTLASNATSLPEITADAAILLQPEDIGAWTEAMLGLVGRPGERERLASLGAARARVFDWQQSAQSLLSLYEEARAMPKRSNPQ